VSHFSACRRGGPGEPGFADGVERRGHPPRRPFAGGTAVVILCVLAIVALFNDDPLRRRLLATGQVWSDTDGPI
jgi:hypothetical protein